MGTLGPILSRRIANPVKARASAFASRIDCGFFRPPGTWFVVGLLPSTEVLGYSPKDLSYIPGRNPEVGIASRNIPRAFSEFAIAPQDVPGGFAEVGIAPPDIPRLISEFGNAPPVGPAAIAEVGNAPPDIPWPLA